MNMKTVICLWWMDFKEKLSVFNRSWGVCKQHIDELAKSKPGSKLPYKGEYDVDDNVLLAAEPAPSEHDKLAQWPAAVLSGTY